MRVGVTGHQDLGSPETVEWLRAELLRLLQELPVSTGLSCLAEGADQLFAAEVLQLGRPLIAVIPCRRYLEAFRSDAARATFEKFLSRASELVALPFDAPSEHAFFAASKVLVERSDITIAIWNNRPAAGLGGTADVVRYALEEGRKVWHLNPVDHTTVFLTPAGTSVKRG